MRVAMVILKNGDDKVDVRGGFKIQSIIIIVIIINKGGEGDGKGAVKENG